ncbi:MAG: hypothetical protein HYV27_19365 [Candidatus Hydrogenedentes bacterium]|nr:hypothetical protein [Candidatus Hydrogenedentota bacterium]
MIRFRLSLIAGVLWSLAASSAWCADRATVGILPFSNPAGVNSAVGNSLADMMTTSLVKTGKFDIIERMELQKVFDEQALGASGAVDAKTAAQIGKNKGADYILIGVVTQAGESEGGGGIGGLTLSRKRFLLAVDVRFVDTTTGKVMFGEAFEHEVKKSQVGVGSAAFSESNPTGGELGREVISTIVNKILLTVFPPRIASIDLATKAVALNYGDVLFDPGQTWEIFREGEAIIDPVSQEQLGRHAVVIGRLSIDSVFDKYSTGRLLDGEGAVGDLCRPDATAKGSEANKNGSSKGEGGGGLIQRMKNSGKKKDTAGGS